MKRIFLFLAVLSLGCKVLRADEGMWVPLLLDSGRYQRMVELGLGLSKEDIFSMNNSSLKDAVVLFDRGCTGVMVSDEGLLFTNHHCGIRFIQNHSTVERDYLTHGFAAGSKAEELSNPGIRVWFLSKIEDVTNEILGPLQKGLSEDQRESYINRNINRLSGAKRRATGNTISIKPFFGGNQYLLFEYEVYSDVRLVLAPPSNIGKFGGDTDNWVWPRHTGDFSIFRVYAGKDNKPAPYSPDNIPYIPRKVAPISLKGVAENDFTMVLGYPGTTEEYVSSEEVNFLLNTLYPNRIKIRSKRLDIMEAAMQADPETRIKYTSKFYGISNGWKKWQGSVKGLTKAGAVEIKKKKELEFQEWLSSNDSLNRKYGQIYKEFSLIYPRYNELTLVNDYRGETFTSVELVSLVSSFHSTFINKDLRDTIGLKDRANRFINYARSFYQNTNLKMDREIFASLMEMYANDIKPGYHPSELQQAVATYKGQFGKWADALYSSSVFADSTRMIKWLKGVSDAKLKRFTDDPAYKLFAGFSYLFNTTVLPPLYNIQITMDSIYREYTAALKLRNGSAMYPDANQTFRISYGKVEGYSPSDAVRYDYFTVSDGILEKDNPSIDDYKLSEGVRALYKNKDFGEFANANGDLPVCFIASNHTSGGNSGSPVFNGRGELIGLNFDRCWEGTMSDLLYDPSQCRNIVADIRYILFVVKNYSKASYLFEELNLVRN